MFLVKLGFSRLSVLNCWCETDKIALSVFRSKRADQKGRSYSDSFRVRTGIFVKATSSDAHSSPVLYLPCAVPMEPKRQVAREPGCSSVGNGDVNFVTPLFQVIFTLYLAWCFFRTIGTSHRPRQPQCYVNNSCLESYWDHTLYGPFLGW